MWYKNILSFVAPSLEFLQTPANSTVTESEMASFQCHVTDPIVSISWSFNQQGTSTTVDIETGTQYSVTSMNGVNVLTISNAQYDQHRGKYTCTASNGAESVSSSAWLDVQGE